MGAPVMSAETLARALGGRRSGRTWLARCPAHDDREPSLAIRDGDDGHVLVHCHAGCDQKDVIDVLRGRGLWNGEPWSAPRSLRSPLGAVPEPDAAGRTEAALRIWGASHTPRGTVVATYLATRGLDLPPCDRLRFHTGLKHPNGMWPGMVALVTDVMDTPVGIHRTFLARDGSGKAPVSPGRMSLGPIRGGAVRLAPVAQKIVIGEGIETVLSVMKRTGTPGWAALSTSGLRTLGLPRVVEEVVVLADADPAGEAAAREAADRWSREGRHVRIARPPHGYNDFNDMLRDNAGSRRVA
jgi:hypothetical protein